MVISLSHSGEPFPVRPCLETPRTQGVRVRASANSRTRLSKCTISIFAHSPLRFSRAFNADRQPNFLTKLARQNICVIRLSSLRLALRHRVYTRDKTRANYGLQTKRAHVLLRNTVCSGPHTVYVHARVFLISPRSGFVMS